VTIDEKAKINKIYKLVKEDFYVNGGHSILLDTLTEEENRRRIQKNWG